MENVKLKDDFTQVVIWPGTVVGAEKVEEFEAWGLEQFGVHFQYLEEIETRADDNGPGRRSDLFFSVRDEDIAKFSVPRLQWGMRWIEDAIGGVGGCNSPYPDRVAGYCCWYV